jgi:hypothetical protein
MCICIIYIHTCSKHFTLSTGAIITVAGIAEKAPANDFSAIDNSA